MTDARREAIKAQFVAERGYWRPWTDTMLQHCPEFVLQYARCAGHPARTGPLSPRLVELIYVGLDASSTHLFESGLHTHMTKAFEVGATTADVLDVLHLVAVQGLTRVCQATDILAEMTGLAHTPAIDPALQNRIDRLGPQHALNLASLARLDPGFVAVLLDFVEQGHPAGGLAPVERSLVQLAMHACFTAFNPSGIRELVAVALSQGASPAEMQQAMVLGAHLSVHGTALGAQVLQKIVAAG